MTARLSDMYLPVDGSYESGPDVHPRYEAVLKVPVEDESLQDGCEEHEEGQCVTPPNRDVLLTGEGDQHSGKV